MRSGFWWAGVCVAMVAAEACSVDGGDTGGGTGGADSGGTTGSGAGGDSETGGSSGEGGAHATGGDGVGSGGVAAGGAAMQAGAGGSLSGTGGATLQGGAPGNGGAGGARVNGGSSGSGGTPSTGGAMAKGGTTANGGAMANGGATAKGGATASGGAPANGGATAKGGTTNTGGAGGSAGAGGVGGTAGASSDGPPAGNPSGMCAIPSGGQPESIANPTTVVGNGTAASCSADAFIAAVAKGGVITFSCGAAPKTIVLDRTAKIFNDASPAIVIDGGGKVTLSGGGTVRILYQNTCDQVQHWTTPNCDNQDHPKLTVQNLTFVDGNATGETMEGGGGGAIFVRGGRFKLVNTRFFRNVCDPTGPDVGGASVRVLDQYEDQPVYVVNSTFGGAIGYGNQCSNGGGLSSIGVSFTVVNSLFSHNLAIGNGANPARPTTPGGGSGGAIYNDGNLFTLSLCGSHLHHNTANEGGGAIFFVSNNRTGTLIIKDCTLSNNLSKGFETQGYPGIFVLTNPPVQVSGSTIE